MGESKIQNQEKSSGCAKPPYLLLILTVGFVLIFAGVLLLIADVMFSSGGSTSSFGVVFIGPFPIVFGSSSHMDGFVVIGGLIIAVLSLLVFIFMCRKVGAA